MPRSSTKITSPVQKPRKTPCPIAFVGECPSEPGETRLFNAILRTANLSKEDYLITNVFDAKPEDEEIGKWLNDQTLIDKNLNRLRDELQRFRPRCVVPLGSTALWAFTGRTTIGDFRGSVLPATKIIAGLKLVPTFNPSAVMKSYKLLPLVTSDFIKAAAEAKLGPKIIYPDVTLLVEPSLSDVKTFLGDCKKSSLLSVDIETGWGQITCIGFAPTADVAMTIPFLDLRKPNKSYWASPDIETDVWLAIKELLEDPNVPKLGQNFTYDAAWLWVKMHIAVKGYREDIRLLHHALYPELPKSLGSMAASYTRLGAWKYWGRGGSEDKKDN